MILPRHAASRSAALAIAVLFLAPVFLSGVVAQAVPDPTDGVVSNVARLAPLGLNATVEAALAGSMITIFHEDFDDGTPLRESGWGEDILLKRENVSSVWHADYRDPASVARGERTAIVNSGEWSASISKDKSYPQDLNHRLTSPVIDLRYVSGAGRSTDELYEADYLKLLASTPAGSYLAALDAVPGSFAGIVDALNDLFVRRIAESQNNNLKKLAWTDDWLTTRPSDIPLTSERYGLGYANLSFYHYYDFAKGHGAYVEIRFQDANGVWSSWNPLDGDLLFETEIDWVETLDSVPACRGDPVPTATKGGAVALPADSKYVCHMANWYNNNYNETSNFNDDTGRTEPGKAPSEPFPPSLPGLSLGPPFVQPTETSYNPYERRMRSPVTITDLYELFTSGEEPEPYTGTVNQTPAYTGKSYRDAVRPAAVPGVPFTDVPLTAEQGHKVVKSVFTLNRYIGTNVQIGFRVEGQAGKFDDYRGWFIDDVRVMAAVPARDVAVDSAVFPVKGTTPDRIAPAAPMVPAVGVKNFGRETAANVTVDFAIRGLEGQTETLRSTRVFAGAVESLETVIVPSSAAFTPTQSGRYRLTTWANLTTSGGLDREEGSTDNNKLDVDFVVDAVYDLTASVIVPDSSVQTDVGAAKSFMVKIENRGNKNASGEIRVSVAKWDPLRDVAAKDPVRLEPRESAFVSPGELPYGKNVTSRGFDRNFVTRNYTWSDTDEAGVYRINVTFMSEAAGTAYASRTFFFVRQTPPPYFGESFETQRTARKDVPFPTDSVEFLNTINVLQSGSGWQTRGYYYTTQLVDDPYKGTEFAPVRLNFPPPMSGSGVWHSSGRDGRVLPTTLPGYDPELQLPVKASSNFIDAYPLEIGAVQKLAPGAGFMPQNVASVHLEFYQWNRFQWSGNDGKDDNRGVICVIRVTAGGSNDDLPACDQRIPNSTGIRHEVFDSPATWKLEKVDLGKAFLGQDVRIQFIHETSQSRGYTDDYVGTKPNTGGKPLAPTYCQSEVRDFTCEELKAGTPLPPWLLDEIRVVAIDTSGKRHNLFYDGAEGLKKPYGDGSSFTLFTNCAERDSSSLLCRGWNASFVPEPYPSHWGLEKDTGFVPPGVLADSKWSLRWGLKDRNDYGLVAYALPYVGQNTICPKDGANKDNYDTTCYVYGVTATPEFSLNGARAPILDFWTQYNFYDLVNYSKNFGSADAKYERNTNGGLYTKSAADPTPTSDAGWYPKVALDGGNVWIVGRDETGTEVVRDLLFPDGGYDARLVGKRPGTGYKDSNHKAKFWILDELKILSARYEPYLTTFAGKSGVEAGEVGDAQWEQKKFDLSKYATASLRDLSYTVEFHGTRQSATHMPSFGWRVDDVRVVEGDFANDVSLTSLESPVPGRVLGPGMELPIVVSIRNEGLFAQKGVNVSYAVYEVTGNNRELVHGPLSEKTGFLSDEDAIPGLLDTAQPDKNRTVVFSKTWKIPEFEAGVTERTYILEAWVDLASSIFPYADDNKANDRFSQEIVVKMVRSSRIAASTAIPDELAVSPAIGPSGAPRSFVTRVENIGTLPEIYDFTNPEFEGQFRVRVDIVDEAGRGVLNEPLIREIRDLPAGDALTVSWPNAWVPTKSGLYTITFTLDHPNETKIDDNTRVVKHEVFDKFFPATGGDGKDEPIADLFTPGTEAWVTNPDRTAGGWSFADGELYGPNQDAALTLTQDLNLKSLRQAFVRVNHSYVFEDSYDGGVLEVSTDDGATWTSLAPVRGYPRAMSTASPLVQDPLKEVRAFSGSSGGYVFDEFNLGKIPSLQTRAILFNDSFDTNRYPQIAGNWTEQSYTVRPHTGNQMWFSNKTAFNCPNDGLDATGKPVNAQSTSTTFGITDDEIGKPLGDVVDTHVCMTYQDPRGGDSYNSRKYLNFTLDFSEIERDPGARLVVTYWDWRAIGISYQRAGDGSSYTPPQSPVGPNGVAVEICCTTEWDKPRPILPKSESNPYNDNYREWTYQEFVVPNVMQQLAGNKRVNVSFVHTAADGRTTSLSPQRVPFDGHPWFRDTDFVSPHIGWAIDDIEIKMIRSDGSIVSLYKDGVDYQSVTEARNNGFDIRGSYWATRQGENEPSIVKQSHVGPNRMTWNLVPGIWFEDTWAFVEVPGRGKVAYAKPLVDTASGTFGGNSARLVSRVDLKSAVDDVHLLIDHAHKFTESGFTAEFTGPASGGRLEVSLDEGRTWVAVDPEGNYGPTNRRRIDVGGSERTLSADGVVPTMNTGTVVSSVHSVFGTDPEGNSAFGPGGKVFYGRNELPSDKGGPGNKPDLYNWKIHNLWKTDSFDLTPYAGKEIWIAFHVGFTTHRFAEGTLQANANLWKNRADFWAIDNVRIDAAVFDGKDVNLRLRAVSDASVEETGWDVQNVELLGVKHLVNVAARIVSPADGALVPAERDVPLVLEVTNKGQDPLRSVRVTVDRIAERTEPAAANWTRIESAPLVDFGPCPGHTIDPLGGLAPETSVRLCSYRGKDLKFYAYGEIPYRLFTEVTHGDLDLEIVVGDNAYTSRIEKAVPFSQVLVKDVVISPNAYDERSGEPVIVKVTVVNEGVDEAVIRDLRITMTGLNMTRVPAPIVLDLSTAEPKILPILKAAREERTYTWVLDPAIFADREDGLFRVNATVVTTCSTGCQGILTDAHFGIAYFGTNYFGQYLDNGKQYTSGGGKIFGTPQPEEPCPARQEWRICADQTDPAASSGGTDRMFWYSAVDMANHTPRYAVGLTPGKRQFNCGGDPNQAPGEGGSGCPPGIRERTMLISPMLSLNDTIGADGERSAFLSFWHALDAGSGHWVRVLARPLIAGSTQQMPLPPPVQPGGGFDTWVVLANFTGVTTPGLSAGAFVPVTLDVAGLMEDAYKSNAYAFYQSLIGSYTGVQVAFEVHSPANLNFGGWTLDDISLSPMGFQVKPEQSYPVTDFTDKMYKYVVSNDGVFTDHFAVAVSDSGGQSYVPPHWVVSASRYNAERGVIERYDSSGDSSRCQPLRNLYAAIDPDAPVVDVVGFRLDAGKSAIINLRVCIPIVENLAGRGGEAPVPLIVKSLTVREAAMASNLDLQYDYKSRSNLVLDPRKDVGLRVNNAELPVNQPRSVEVLVKNTGQVPARNVLVGVVAVPDPALGAANETLTKVDGSPVAPIPIVPPGEGRTVTLLWTPKNVGDYTLVATIDPKNTVIELAEDDNTVQRTIRIGRASFPDLEIRASVSNLQPNVGDEVKVVTAITNHGGVAASGIQINLKIGVTDLLPQSPFFLPKAIAPGETVYVNKTWTAVFPGKVLLYASAIPRGGVLERVETQDNNLFVETLLVRSLGLDLAVGKGLSLAPGAAGRTKLVVGNGGETPDSYNLDVRATGAIGAFLELEGRRVSSVGLQNGTSQEFSLVVDVPLKTPAGEYAIDIVARSQNTSQSKSIQVPLVVLPEYGLALDGKIISVKPGRVELSLGARNLGNARDPVKVEVASALRRGWTVESPTTVLAPYAKAQVPLVLNIPTGEIQGLYDIAVRVVDELGYAADARVTLEIGNLERVRPTFAAERVDTRPLSLLAFNVTVANEGNVRAEAGLVPEHPTGWTMTVDGPKAVVLEPGTSTTVPITVFVPARAAVGEYPVGLVVNGLDSTGRGTVNVRVRGSDLAFADVDYAPRVNLKSDTPMNFTATVENVGGIRATNVSVAFYVDDALLGFETLEKGIGPGETAKVAFAWKAVAGSHSVVVVIDPGLEIEEEDENNNARVLDIRVAAEEGFLSAAENAVPVPGLGVLLLVLIGVALAMPRRRRR